MIKEKNPNFSTRWVKYDNYEIIIETADEFVPNRVIDSLGMFAEVQTVAQGQKAVFKKKLGRYRAKKFLTQVGLSGVYETFRLDSDTFEVPAKAVGGAVTIDYERMLDGAETMADVMDIITEGLVDSVYLEIQKALKAALNAKGRPTAELGQAKVPPLYNLRMEKAGQRQLGKRTSYRSMLNFSRNSRGRR